MAMYWGQGRGWANTILYHHQIRDLFENFFERKETFTLGVCNGCQMLSHLKDLIPGAECWPTFLPNLSAQFEARVCPVKIEDSPSVLFDKNGGRNIAY